MTTSTFHLLHPPLLPPQKKMFTEASEPFRQGNSVMAPEEKEKLAKKKKNNISACKDFIHGINQLRADRSFSPW